MKFSQDFIEKVREANNIVGEISKYTELNRRGSRLMGLCPFPDHNEKTGSFSVSEDKQVYYCFGCKKSGNLYTFIQQMRGLSFPETVELLAHQAGIEVPKDEGQGGNYKPFKTKRKLVDINAFAADFYHRQLTQLPDTDPRIEYLARRSINKEIIEKFKLGLAHDSWDLLFKDMQKNRVSINDAAKLGLLKTKTGGGHYDTYRHRLMFPIFSLTGDCIGFGGRTLGNDKAKYINSSESDLFHKSKSLYGLHETAKFIRSQDQAIVVEGYMDLVALYQRGIKNVVAVLGTALTEQHAKLIKRLTRNVVLLFDGDSSGQEAAERSLPNLLGQDLFVKSIELPDNMDPDDFIKKEGAEKLQELVRSAPDLFSKILQTQLKRVGTSPSDKVKILDHMGEFLKAVNDHRLLNLYTQELAESLDQSPNWVKRGISDKRPKEFTKSTASNVKEVKGSIKLDKAPKAELYLLNLALSRAEFLDKLDREGVLEQFSSHEIRRIFSRALEAYRQMPNDFDKLTALLATEIEPAGAVTQHLDKQWSELDSESSEKLFNDCKRKVQEAFLKKKQELLRQKWQAGGHLSSREQLEQFMNIQKTRKALKLDEDKN